MELKFGIKSWEKRQDNREIPYGIDYSKVINPHMIIVGGSGSGKTYNLRKIVNILSNRLNAKFHIIDVHRDILFDDMSSITFSETSEYGINPLKISSNKEFGGVRKRIQSLINSINRTSRKLGTKQEAVLRNLLLDLYNANRFYEDDPNSWGLNDNGYSKYPKKYPTLIDLKRFTEAKYKKMIFGINKDSVRGFEELKKLNNKLNRLLRDREKNQGDIVKIENNIQKVKLFIIETFTKSIQTANGYEIDDLMKYDSADVLKSVLERISNLEATGIFKNKYPEFDFNKSIYRYDVGALSRDEQRMFVDFVAEDLFNKSREQGQKQLPDKFLVIDEAKIFLNDIDDDYILNIISREARKFGFGLILSTQSLEHIPQDIIESTATKLILGVDETKFDITARKLSIEKKYLKYIIPHKTALVQVKEAGNNSNNYKLIELLVE